MCCGIGSSYGAIREVWCSASAFVSLSVLPRVLGHCNSDTGCVAEGKVSGFEWSTGRATLQMEEPPSSVYLCTPSPFHLKSSFV